MIAAAREGAAYDTVLALHVLAGVIGFGAMGMTGYFAERARRHPEAPAVRRYFRPGVNWPARSVFLVPVLGVALLEAGGNRTAASSAWVLIGIVTWMVATGLAVTILWPGERRVAGHLESGAFDAALHSLCRRMGAAAAASTVLYLAALWAMVAKPG